MSTDIGGHNILVRGGEGGNQANGVDQSKDAQQHRQREFAGMFHNVFHN